jgi:hypothetical protein
MKIVSAGHLYFWQKIHCIKSEVYLAKPKWILQSGPKLKMLVSLIAPMVLFPIRWTDDG